MVHHPNPDDGPNNTYDIIQPVAEMSVGVDAIGVEHAVKRNGNNPNAPNTDAVSREKLLGEAAEAGSSRWTAEAWRRGVVTRPPRCGGTSALL